MEDYSKVTFMEYMEKKKAIIKSLGGKGNDCIDIWCSDCPFMGQCRPMELGTPEKALELVMNYEIPVDWTKVPVDTPIYVSDSEEGEWLPQYFSGFVNGKVFAWVGGKTSFSAKNKLSNTISWNFAKLKDPVKENGGE